MSAGYGGLDLHDVLDALPFGVHVWERSAGDGPPGTTLRLAYANDTARLLLPDMPDRVGLEHARVFPNDELAARVAGEIADAIASGNGRENILVEREGMQPLRLTIRPFGDRCALVAFRPRGAVRSRATPEQFLDALFYAAEDAILTKDAAGVITSWNPAAERLYGFRASEVVGKPVDLLLPADRLDEVRRILDRLAVGERVASFETKRLTKDGRTLDVSLTISPIRDQEDEFVGAAAIARDLTTQKLIEARLEQRERLEAVGRLAGAIAHDFNNVLTVVRASAELVLTDPSDEDAVAQAAASLLATTDLAAALTSQLLAFARNQVVRPRGLDLGALVRRTMSTLEPLLGEQIQVTVDLADEGLSVLADESQLQQVILNLCVNARDAMPDGGTLTLEAQPVAISASAVELHPGIEPGAYVSLEITDTGTGMDAATVERIFEPFFTTKPEGTGLGLATAYGAVKQSGGHLLVYSEQGLGTTFRVLLPAHGGPVESVVEEPAAETVGDRRLSILYVEDTDAVRNVVVRLLEAEGHDVVAAAAPLDALDHIERSGADFDVLVTDMVMPGMTGVELAARVRERRPELNVVFTSGYPAEVSMADALADARTEFVQKPFGVDALLRVIARLPVS